eukprot:GEMP01073935.1.p1 GENE.GEMP01073935.1~~GEMP01073935.1.p1  ORF type:complete len:216 (+),score=-12.91 GEMP01073935.1:214-861(+)
MHSLYIASCIYICHIIAHSASHILYFTHTVYIYIVPLLFRITFFVCLKSYRAEGSWGGNFLRFYLFLRAHMGARVKQLKNPATLIVNLYFYYSHVGSVCVHTIKKSFCVCVRFRPFVFYILNMVYGCTHASFFACAQKRALCSPFTEQKKTCRYLLTLNFFLGYENNYNKSGGGGTDKTKSCPHVCVCVHTAAPPSPLGTYGPKAGVQSFFVFFL